MKPSNIVLSALAVTLLAAAGQAQIKRTLSAPKAYVGGQPYVAKLTLENAGTQAEKLSTTLFDGGELSVDGKPLAKRAADNAVSLPAQAKLTLELDLAPLLAQSEAGAKATFTLAWHDQNQEVSRLEPAKAGTDFMTIPEAELGDYHVLMLTNRGELHMEFWPEVAPNHVRNFLDLCASGFYDGATFHRVIPGFMIQGGDKKNGDGSGSGPRPVKAEFNDRKHVPGVLSMARQGTPNTPGPQDPLKDTASCQFFVMSSTYPSLDGNYTAFGKLVSGQEVVEKIVSTRTGALGRPVEPQTIVKATVIRVPR